MYYKNIIDNKIFLKQERKELKYQLNTFFKNSLL